MATNPKYVLTTGKRKATDNLGTSKEKKHDTERLINKFKEQLGLKHIPFKEAVMGEHKEDFEKAAVEALKSTYRTSFKNLGRGVKNRMEDTLRSTGKSEEDIKKFRDTYIYSMPIETLEAFNKASTHLYNGEASHSGVLLRTPRSPRGTRHEFSDGRASNRTEGHSEPNALWDTLNKGYKILGSREDWSENPFLNFDPEIQGSRSFQKIENSIKRNPNLNLLDKFIYTFRSPCTDTLDGRGGCSESLSRLIGNGTKGGKLEIGYDTPYSRNQETFPISQSSYNALLAYAKKHPASIASTTTTAPMTTGTTTTTTAPTTSSSSTTTVPSSVVDKWQFLDDIDADEAIKKHDIDEAIKIENIHPASLTHRTRYEPTEEQFKNQKQYVNFPINVPGFNKYDADVHHPAYLARGGAVFPRSRMRAQPSHTEPYPPLLRYLMQLHGWI